MQTELDLALVRAGGAMTRAALLQEVGRTSLDDQVRRGQLIALFPRVYGRPWAIDDPEVWDVAAVRYASPNGLLSHSSALRRFGLADGNLRELYVTVPASRGLRGVRQSRHGKSLYVHRVVGSYEPDISTGVPCVAPESALVQAWPDLKGAAQRAATITAVRQNLVTIGALEHELSRHPTLIGRAKMCALAGLLEAGCQSELEIWGYRDVFATKGFAGGVWQHWVKTSRGRFRIDLAFLQARLAVELDGRTYHSSASAWEHDIARDLALATIGWQTIRLSHDRLTKDVAGCRRDVLAVLKHRTSGALAAA